MHDNATDVQDCRRNETITSCCISSIIYDANSRIHAPPRARIRSLFWVRARIRIMKIFTVKVRLSHLKNFRQPSRLLSVPTSSTTYTEICWGLRAEVWGNRFDKANALSGESKNFLRKNGLNEGFSQRFSQNWANFSIFAFSTRTLQTVICTFYYLITFSNHPTNLNQIERILTKFWKYERNLERTLPLLAWGVLSMSNSQNFKERNLINRRKS